MNIMQKAETGFAQIKNEVLFDSSISMKAKGLFAYLYAKPDDWDFSGDRIALEMREGRKAVYSTLKELESAGYLLREKQVDGRVVYALGWEKKPVAQNGQLGTEPTPQKGKEPKGQVAEMGSISNKDSGKETKIEINTIATTSVAEGYDFDFSIQKFKESDDKRFPILAAYFEVKGYQFGNKDQHVSAVQRNLRASKLLIGYPVEHVVNTMGHLSLNADFKWTLETVGKYIDDYGAKKKPISAPAIPTAEHDGKDLGFALT